MKSKKRSSGKISDDFIVRLKNLKFDKNNDLIGKDARYEKKKN